MQKAGEQIGEQKLGDNFVHRFSLIFFVAK